MQVGQKPKKDLSLKSLALITLWVVHNKNGTESKFRPKPFFIIIRVWLQTPHYANTSSEVAVFHLIRIPKAVYHFKVILFELMTRNENTSFDKAWLQPGACKTSAI